MNITKLMSRPEAALPVVGGRYVVQEWDDSLESVVVIKATRKEVEFEYPDGVRHRVSFEYFSEAIAASRVH